MKYANYVRTSRYLAGPILSALALAACAIDTGTPPTPEDAESETSTREAAIEEATDAPSNTGWEAPSPIIHRQKISPAAHAAWVERAKSRRAASRRDRSQPGASATPGLAPISGEAPEGASVASMVVQLAEPGFAFERFRGRTPEERPPSLPKEGPSWKHKTRRSLPSSKRSVATL